MVALRIAVLDASLRGLPTDAVSIVFFLSFSFLT